MKLFYVYCGIVLIALSSCAKTADELAPFDLSQVPQDAAVATFSGGCFWCMEPPFEKHAGVYDAVSGYAGGTVEQPTYEEVSAGTTGHRESVQVYYDPTVIAYEELLDIFWRQINPTDEGGQFVDRGFQYSSAIFYRTEAERRAAEESKAILARSGRYQSPIITPVLPYTHFYTAENYHQDYYKTHSLKYNFYRERSGRDDYLESIWGTDTISHNDYMKPSDEELKEMLTPLQYKVTQRDGTEKPFDNEYWDNHADGIYVDIVSGEPLYSSKDKYESGTGWPSFTKPLVPENIVEREDNTFFTKRTEVRSAKADSHLGHVFPDGPEPTGMRYCMNSAALRFIPKENLETEGYGEYLSLFE